MLAVIFSVNKDNSKFAYSALIKLFLSDCLPVYGAELS